MNKVFALILIVISFPFLFIIGILIVLFEQKTPLFYQNRFGKNKSAFQLIKLRTMKNDKVTLIGSILRKTGIDEIPQLINILKGDMNFIGPRPLTQNDVTRLDWDSNHYTIRWEIKPGLTGLAQLSPVCHKKISFFYDKYYVNNQSFILDFKIFVLSTFVLFLGKNRVKKIISNRK